MENVFQLTEVKERINEVCLEKYGQLRITNPKAISQARQEFTPEKKQSILDKCRETRNSWDEEKRSSYLKRRGNITREYWNKVNDDFLSRRMLPKMNKVEEKLALVLETIGIDYIFSRFVARRQFDFEVLGRKVLIEVQGDFWHANPEIYSEDSEMRFPGGKRLAREVWRKDLEKKELAESYGYKVLYVWEKELRYFSLKEMSQRLENQLNSLSSSSPVS